MDKNDSRDLHMTTVQKSEQSKIKTKFAADVYCYILRATKVFLALQMR